MLLWVNLKRMTGLHLVPGIIGLAEELEAETGAFAAKRFQRKAAVSSESFVKG